MMRKHVVILVLICCSIGCLTASQTSRAQQFPASAITVEAVMQQLQENRDLVLVDVREPQAFERFRIPSSLNIPLFAVKTKAFLKTKPVVLVDEGYRPRQLEETCEQLQRAGFDARFLFGGLNAWRMWSAKFILLPLQGDIFTWNTLNRMPPQALFAEQEGEYWLVVDVSASGEVQPVPGGTLHPPTPLNNVVDLRPSVRGELVEPPADRPFDKLRANGDTLKSTVLTPLKGGIPSPASPQGGNVQPQALSVPFDRDHSKQFLADIEHAVAHAPTRSEWFLIVIANQHGEDYEAIERVLQNTWIAPVFFLEGGFAAYTRFVIQQNQIRQGQPQDITTSCPSCPAKCPMDNISY